MKNLLFAALAFLLIFPALAAAKTVFFVTSYQSPTEDCSDMPALSADRLMCSEIQKIGYSVIVKNENAVVTNSWDAEVSAADLIFLGTVSPKLSNTSDPSRAAQTFCNYIFNSDPSGSVPRNIQVFSALSNNYVNRTAGTWGCGAVRLAELLPHGADGKDAALDDNICDTGTFKKQADGYVSRDLPRIVSVYTKTAGTYVTSPIVSNDNATVWIVDECTPRGRAPSAFYGNYPVVLSAENFMFFGPNYPQLFTATMWKLFDRAVVYMMNDYLFEFSYVQIPEYPTSNNSISLYISAPKNSTVKVSYGAQTKILKYNNVSGFYETGDFSFGSAANYTLFVETADKLRSATNSIPVSAGSVQINSLNAVRKDSNTIALRASVDDPAEIASAKYKVWNRSLAVVAEGELIYKEGSFQADAAVSDGEIIFEADMTDIGGRKGGAYKEFSLGAKPMLGRDFTISPNEIFLSYPEARTFPINFTLDALRLNITNLKVSASGLGGITIDSTGLGTTLKQGSSGKFSALVNLAGVSGKSSGKIIVSSNDFIAEVPIEAVVDTAILGSKWLSMNPKIWKVTVSEGGSVEKNFTLTSLGQYHANEISFEATGNFSGLLSYEKIPYIRAGRDAISKLSLDASSLSPGKYSGKINVYTSIGNDSAEVSIEVVHDYSSEIATLRENLTVAEGLLEYYGNRSVDISDAQKKIDEAKSVLQEAELKIASQDYGGAKLLLESAQTKVDSANLAAKSLKEPFPILLVAGGVLILIIIILLFIFRGKIKEIFEKLAKKKKPAPEEEPPPEEERYQPPEEQGSGYKTEYY